MARTGLDGFHGIDSKAAQEPGVTISRIKLVTRYAADLKTREPREFVSIPVPVQYSLSTLMKPLPRFPLSLKLDGHR